MAQHPVRAVVVDQVGGRWRRRAIGSEWASVIVVVVIGVALTAASARFTSASLARRQGDELERRAVQYRALIERRLASYVEVLHGLRGMFAASPAVSSREFATFVDIGRYTIRKPGTVAISFARAVSPARVVVDYIEPKGQNSAALGFDMLADPIRRAAVEDARDTGEAVATAPIELVQDPGGPPAFLLCLAIYDTESLPVTDAARRRHFVGVVTIQVRTQHMFETVLGRPSDLTLSLFDVGVTVDEGLAPLPAANLIYLSGGTPPAAGGARHVDLDLDAGTRRWRLVATAGAGFTNATERFAALAVTLGGVLVTLLLAGLVLSSSRARRRAERLAAAMTVDLRNRAAELERSNAELERFAYVASHDLQEPLRMVSSYVGRLGERYADQFDDRGRRYLHYAVDGAERMQGLIEALLEYSRVGRAEPDRQPLDMGIVVDQVVEHTLRGRIREAGAHLVVDPLPTVDADEVLMRQLVQNLLANALKFRPPERRPELRLSARRCDGGWEFAVDDNGIGIDPRYRTRVFEVFRRLHPASEYRGAGVGLAICQRIVEHHGGTIWIEDSPLGGTRVLFTIPGAERPSEGKETDVRPD